MRSETPKKAASRSSTSIAFDAEAAAGFVDDAAKSFVRLPIVGHGRKAQQRQRVLDLGASVEADVPDETIGDPGPHQGFLEAAGEEVVAIENRHLGPTSAFALAGQQRLGEASGFGVAVTIAHDLDASPLPFPGEERFAEARLVLRDDRVGGREDMAGRAKVLLEPDVDGVGKVTTEPAYVRHISAAPAVDRLVIVTNGEDPLAMRGKHLQPGVLSEIDVLVFVGVNPIELPGPSRPVIGVLEERERRPEEKIAEVRGVRFPQPSLIFPVGAGGRQKSAASIGALARFASAIRFWTCAAAAFGVISRSLNLAMWPATILTGSRLPLSSSSVERFSAFMTRRSMRRASSASRMSKFSTQGGDFGGAAKLTGRQAVECAEPIGRRVRAERSADAVRHLACRLIGERDGEHPMRRNAIDRDAVRDRGGEGRGLARSCPGQDQDRARMSRGCDLGVCQGRGKRIERGGCMAGPFFEGNGRARHRFAGDRRPFVVSRVFGARITVEAGIAVEVGIVEVRLLRHDRLSGMALHEGLARVRSRAFGMAAGAGTREQVRGIAA